MDDLISRQAAIDAIKALWNNAPSAQHVSAMFDCEDAIRALPSAQPKQTVSNFIESLPTSPLLVGKMPSARPETNCSEIPNNWIPCSERLPETEGVYIITDDAGGMATVELDKFICRDDGWFTWLYAQNATAWMPLPEPYKEMQKDGKTDR